MKRCRHCRRPIPPRDESPDQPFCSERCRLVDLNRWMTGDYLISSPLPDGEEPLAHATDRDED